MGTITEAEVAQQRAKVLAQNLQHWIKQPVTVQSSVAARIEGVRDGSDMNQPAYDLLWGMAGRPGLAAGHFRRNDNTRVEYCGMHLEMRRVGDGFELREYTPSFWGSLFS